MAKLKSHKNQHYVPSSYLRAWCDPVRPEGHEPFVWVFAKQARSGRPKSPANLFSENEMYTVIREGGSRDLAVESLLNALETAFIQIRDRRISTEDAMSPEEFEALCAFVAAMYARTPRYRSHTQSQWGHARRIMEELKQKMEAATKDQRQAMTRALSFGAAKEKESGLNYEQVKRLAEHPLPVTVPSMVRTATQVLSKMDPAILVTDDKVGFITSDSPCVWFDPEAYKRPPFYRSVGLGWPTIEVTLPLTPRHCLLLTRRGLQGYVPVGPVEVAEINRRTRFHCDEQFVVSRHETRPYWYKRGVKA